LANAGNAVQLHRGSSERLEQETEARELLRLRCENQGLVRLKLDRLGEQQTLDLNLAALRLFEETLEQDALVRHVLVDQEQPSRSCATMYESLYCASGTARRPGSTAALPSPRRLGLPSNPEGA
jgi:hypothetical protein